MNNKEFRLYIQKLKEEHNLDISDELLEKDYILSNFLSSWANKETPNLDNLIFKGGTLLTKNYLNYHRISEDLDFTHKDSNNIRLFNSTNQRENKIKKLIKPILEEIAKLAKNSNLSFINDRTNSKYIQIKNSRSVYIISLYYKSQVTNIEQFIKLEINFVENIQNNPQLKQIQTIHNYYPLEKSFLNVINYNIKEPKLLTYPISEIVLEKIRATMTRYQFKPRDVFDLFLINKEFNVFETSYDNIKIKLDSSAFIHDTQDNMKKFLESNLNYDLEDIDNLSLINYDNEKFHIFETHLIQFLKEIANKYLKKNNQFFFRT